MVQRIPIEFCGEGAATAGLTWAQRGIWRTVELLRTPQLVSGFTVLPTGTTLESVVSGWRYVMERHPALRTQLRVDEPGEPRQEVFRSGTVTLDIVDADGEPAAVAAEVLDRLEDSAVDPFSNWPVRLAVVRVGGRLTHAVAVYDHLVIDADGLDLVMADLAATGGRTDGRTVPLPGLQPWELAERQRLPGELRRGERSLRHWDRLLRSVPPRPGLTSGERQDPLYWELSWHSPAAATALLTLQAALTVSSSAILLAAYATALGAVTGHDPVVVQLGANNRFRPGFDRAVTPVAQAGLCAVRLGGASFADIAARAAGAALAAYQCAYFDPDRLIETIAAAAEHGELDVSYYFNDRRRLRAAGTRPPGVRPGVAAGTASGEPWRWQRRFSRSGYSVSLHIEADTDDSIDLVLCADTSRLGPAAIVGLARDVEATLIAAASLV